jgi:hypothetical protein
MLKRMNRLTGASLPGPAFRLHETDREIDVPRVFEVLRGDLAAYRIRGFVPVNACSRIANNFWSSPDRVARPGDGENGVEGYFIGASHYGKTSLQYLGEAMASRNAIERVYAGTINPGSVFRAALSAGTGKAVQVRPARLNGLSACDSKAVHWTGSGTFLLEPHDDLAQLRSPEQKDFEIQRADRVLAVNIYAEVPVNSGQVQLWNIEPDDRTRANLGLTNIGFPYPADMLTECPSIIIPVETGDLCVLNGNLVHAVLRGNPMSPQKRLLITFFMALQNDDELIWWT